MADAIESDAADEVIETMDSNEENSEEGSYEGNEGDEFVESEGEAVDAEDASDEELKDVLEDDDASTEDKKEAVAELSKRISMKINGKDEEFDLADDDHIAKLKSMAQKGEGADQKFQEAADLKKKMEAFAEECVGVFVYHPKTKVNLYDRFDLSHEHLYQSVHWLLL